MEEKGKRFQNQWTHSSQSQSWLSSAKARVLRPDVTGTEHRFGLAKKGKEGYKGHSGQRWKMSTPETEGFLQVVLTLNWAKSQWRRERRVSFHISVAYRGSELSDAVRTAGRVSQHSQEWTTEPLQEPGRLRPRISGATITITKSRIDQLITISQTADANQEVVLISSGPINGPNPNLVDCLLPCLCFN